MNGTGLVKGADAEGLPVELTLRLWVDVTVCVGRPEAVPETDTVLLAERERVGEAVADQV